MEKDEETKLSVERQKYQLHKKGYESVTKAIESLKEVEREPRPEVQKVELTGISVVTLKGDKGDSPTKDELIEIIEPLMPTDSKLESIIKPLIPKPIKGDDGKDYKLTEKDKKQIAKSIQVPVVEKVVEKVVVEQPIIKEVENKDTPDEIVSKLQTVKKEWLDINAIKGDFNSRVSRIVHTGGATGVLEAPIDGNQYARKDGDWTIVTGGSSSGVIESIVAGTGISVDNTDPANPIVTNTGGDFKSDGSVAMTGGLEITNPNEMLFYAKRTDVFDFVQYRRAAGTWTDITLEAGRSRGTVSGDVLDAIGDTLVIGKSTTFNSIYIDIGTVRSATGTFVWEYSLGGDTWATLTCTDGTNALLTDGVVSFTPPIDWATDSQNGSTSLYFVRLRADTGTFSTEPTVYLVVPGDGTRVMEIYANGNDVTPVFYIDAQGNTYLGTGGSNTVSGSLSSTSFSTGTLAASGAITQTFSSTGYAATPGHNLNSPSATALIPSQNSPVTRYSAHGWNGVITKANVMDVYLNPDSEAITQARLVWKNTTENGYADQSELMNLDNDGRLSLLGRAQSSYKTFDSCQRFVTGVYTDDTSACQTLGLDTGDVLNAVGDYFYIGKRDTFENVYFDFGTIISGATVRSWEYWNGSAWTALTVTDGTNNWLQDGNTSFTAPVDWAKTTVNKVGPIYFIRVGTVSGTFTTEPTLRFCLPQARADVFSNGEMDSATGWDVTGDWAYSTLDHTFTFSSGSGTLTQQAINFATPAKANTWYRFRYVLGVVGATGTLAWIGDEFASGKTYFQTSSTTEVDVFFKSNSNPGDFVIYTTAPASGLRIDSVELIELTGGEIQATGNITGLNLSGTNTGDQDLSGYALTSSIPTATSDLTNDSGFITAGDIPSIPVNSDFNLGGLGDVNDTGKATGKVLKYNSVSGDWEVGDATVEGVDVLSTGETGGVKYLRENGDGTCSWVEPSGGGQTLYDIVVAPTGGDYTTLSAAIAAATTGQTIFVKSGTYTESSTINFYGIATDLRIIGENPNTTIIELDGATNGISLSKARPSFEDLQFTSDISNQNMVYGGDSGTNIYFSFNNCIFNALSSSLYTWFNVVNGDRDQVRKITNCKFYGTPDNYTASLYFNTPNLQFTNNFIYSTSHSGGLIASFSNERNNVSNNQWIVKKLNGIEFLCEQGVFSDNSYYCNNDFYSRQILDLRGSDNLVTGNSLKTRQDNNTWLTYAYISIGGTRNLFEGNSVGRGEGKTLTANTMVYVYGSNTVITGNFFGKIAGNKHVTISAADCYESKNVKLKTDGNLTPFYTNTDNATATIDCDNYSEYYLTAVANDTAFSVTGTPHVGQTITVGFKDAGVSKNITWSSITELGITLPTATVAGKQHIVELKYIGGAWRAISAIVEA